MADKAKYWTSVLYPENMIDGWQDKLEDILQIPFAYCVHDKDHLQPFEEDLEHDERKIHLHIDLAFTNTTTYNHVLKLLQSLSSDPKKPCCNTVQKIISIRYAYNYLIHDTESCRKKNKHLYDPSERIEGNNFDIGAYEQLSLDEKIKIKIEIANLITENEISNFAILWKKVNELYSEDREVSEVLMANNGFFDRLCKGYWHIKQDRILSAEKDKPVSSGTREAGTASSTLDTRQLKL